MFSFLHSRAHLGRELGELWGCQKRALSGVTALLVFVQRVAILTGAEVRALGVIADLLTSAVSASGALVDVRAFI